MGAVKRRYGKVREIGDQARPDIAIRDAEGRDKKLPDETVKGADKARKHGRRQYPFFPEPCFQLENGTLRK